ATGSASSASLSQLPRLIAKGPHADAALASALVSDESADLVRRREDHVGTVAHHTGAHQGRRALLRAIIADIGLEAQITLPEIANFPIRSGDFIGISAMID